MADESNCQLPRELRAGDSAKWRRTLADYPAGDGWQLTYTLVGRNAFHAIPAAADGDGFTVTLSTSDTAPYAPGHYSLVEYVSRAGDRHTLGSTPLQVLPDLASVSTGVDTRSHARKVLDNLNAWMEAGDLSAGEMQLGERRIRNYPLPELLALRDRYAAMVAREECGGKGLVRRMVVHL